MPATYHQTKTMVIHSKNNPSPKVVVTLSENFPIPKKRGRKPKTNTQN
jgi:hypothetical protein